MTVSHGPVCANRRSNGPELTEVASPAGRADGPPCLFPIALWVLGYVGLNFFLNPFNTDFRLYYAAARVMETLLRRARV